MQKWHAWIAQMCISRWSEHDSLLKNNLFHNIAENFERNSLWWHKERLRLKPQAELMLFRNSHCSDGSVYWLTYGKKTEPPHKRKFRGPVVTLFFSDFWCLKASYNVRLSLTADGRMIKRVHFYPPEAVDGTDLLITGLRTQGIKGFLMEPQYEYFFLESHSSVERCKDDEGIHTQTETQIENTLNSPQTTKNVAKGLQNNQKNWGCSYQFLFELINLFLITVVYFW